MANPSMNYEIPSEMRDMAEKSVQQARQALGGFLGAAQKAVDTVQGSTNTMQSSATDATRKTLAYAEQNISATFDHAQRLVRAKDIQEAISIQTEFAKTQFAAMQTQMRELGEMAQSAARTATEHATNAAKDAAATARAAAEKAGAGAQQAMSNTSNAMNRTSES